MLRADDSAFSEGRGCYTTARSSGGRIRFEERHVARLVRAAGELRLGRLDPERVRRALRELAAAAFGDGEGIVRVQASRDGKGELHVVGVPRRVGPEPDTWRACVVAQRHAAEGLDAGLKVTSRLALTLARDVALDAGLDEALLLDAGGFLIEGAGCNVVVVPPGGAPATPPAGSGAVSGVARGVVLERVPEIEERRIPEAELRCAAEIIGMNAVRGARAITELDGAPVGEGKPGPWAARLDAALAED